MTDPQSTAARDQYWRRRLGRLRLGVEPLEEQLERYRRATWVLTGLPVAIGGFILALFTAFGSPGTGAVVSLVLFSPIVVLAWWDYARLRGRVREYRRENGSSPPGEKGLPR